MKTSHLGKYVPLFFKYGTIVPHCQPFFRFSDYILAMNSVLTRISSLKNNRSLAGFCLDVGLNYEKLKKAFQRDTIPDAESLHKIACHFHVDLGWLFSGLNEASSLHQYIGQKLSAIRRARNERPKEFACRIGLTPAVLDWYESGSAAICFSHLEKACALLGLPPEDLFGLNTPPPAPPELKIVAPASLDHGPGIHNEDYISIPLTTSAIAAGQPIIQEENIEDYVLLHIRAAGKRQDLVASRVDGDSMEPMLHSGDIVVIDRQDKSIARNKMYAVFYEDGLTAKYLEQQGDWLILRPINPNSQVQIIRPGEQNNPIVGRIIGSWKEL